MKLPSWVIQYFHFTVNITNDMMVSFGFNRSIIMTKGHFHQIVDTAEVYYTLKGEGYMMLENLEGDWKVERMERGKALYVPRGYAHRCAKCKISGTFRTSKFIKFIDQRIIILKNFFNYLMVLIHIFHLRKITLCSLCMFGQTVI